MSKRSGARQNQLAAIILLPFLIVVEGYFIGTIGVIGGIMAVTVAYFASIVWPRKNLSITREAATIVLAMFLFLAGITRSLIGPAIACLLALTGVLGCYLTFRLWKEG